MHHKKIRNSRSFVKRPCRDTSNVEDRRWEPLLVDAVWRAFSKAIFKGFGGTERETPCGMLGVK